MVDLNASVKEMKDGRVAIAIKLASGIEGRLDGASERAQALALLRLIFNELRRLGCSDAGVEVFISAVARSVLIDKYDLATLWGIG
jgi:hypothetical protein